MTTNPDPVPVLIVGAGPTGLTAATLLAQRGIRSLLLERHTEVYPLPRAVHLDDEILRILQQAGVADDFTALSRPARGLRLLDRRMRTIAEFRRDKQTGHHGWPQANLFDQPDLEQLLRDKLTEHPECEFLPGVEVTHIDPGDHSRPAHVHLRHLATGAVNVVSAQTVLGCDGANSLVRTTIGAQLRDLKFEEDWLVVDVRCTREFPIWDGVDQVCDPRRPATFMRIGTDRYRWEFRLLPGESAESLSDPETLAPLLRPWTGTLPISDLQIMRSAAYTFKARVADTWHQGRLFLLGDAAHLTPPFIGQGMGAGLRDAANLTWKLAAANADPTGHEELLHTYETERKAHATHLIRVAVATGWAMTGGQDRAAALRRLLLAAAVRIPGTNTAAMQSLSPRLRPGPLVLRPPRPSRRSRLAGTHLPQPILTVEGTTHRLDNLIGDGFTIVTRHRPTPEINQLGTRLNATMLYLRPTGIDIETPHGHRYSATDTTLSTWLDRHNTDLAIIRPDRIVLTALSQATTLTDPDLARWTQLIPSTTRGATNV